MQTEHPAASYLPPHSKKVFQGEIFSVWQWPQKLYDGTTKNFEILTRPDTAYLLAVMEDEKLLLIQDEQPQRGPVLTIPRGRVEAGETAQDAARRELQEETGYGVKEITLWHSHRPWGKVSWNIYYFIGRGAYKIGDATVDPGERIALRPTSFEDFVELGAQGALQDPQLQIMMLQAKLDSHKMAEFKKILYG